MTDLPGPALQRILHHLSCPSPPHSPPHDILALSAVSSNMASAITAASGFALFAHTVLGLNPHQPNSSFRAFRQCAYLSRAQSLVMQKYADRGDFTKSDAFTSTHERHASTLPPEYCFVQLLSLLNRTTSTAPSPEFNSSPLWHPIPLALRQMAAFYIASLGHNTYPVLFDNDDGKYPMSESLKRALYYCYGTNALLYLAFQDNDDLLKQGIAKLLEQNEWSVMMITHALTSTHSPSCPSSSFISFCKNGREYKVSRKTFNTLSMILQSEMSRRMPDFSSLRLDLFLFTNTAISYFRAIFCGQIESSLKHFESTLKHYISEGFNIQSMHGLVQEYLGQRTFSPYLGILFRHGLSLNSGQYDIPLLFSASWTRRVDVFRILLQNGANPNDKYRNGGISTTFILIRRATYDVSRLRLLLDYGGNIDHVGDTYTSVHILYHAVLAGNSQLTLFVLQEVANKRIAPPQKRLSLNGPTLMHMLLGTAEIEPDVIEYALSLKMDKTFGSLHDVDSRLNPPIVSLIENRLHYRSLISVLRVLFEHGYDSPIHSFPISSKYMAKLPASSSSSAFPFFKRLKKIFQKSFFSPTFSTVPMQSKSAFLTACELALITESAARVALFFIQHGADVTETDSRNASCLSWIPSSLTKTHTQLVAAILRSNSTLLTWPLAMKLLFWIIGESSNSTGLNHFQGNLKQRDSLAFWGTNLESLETMLVLTLPLTHDEDDLLWIVTSLRLKLESANPQNFQKLWKKYRPRGHRH